MKKLLTFLLTAALLATASVSVLADDVTDAEAGIEAISLAQPLTLEGMTQIEVTTADSNMNIDVANFFDMLADTGCTIAFPEGSESRTFSLYTATRVPEAVAKFATILDGEQGTVLTFEVYGTNDSLLTEWTPLEISLDDVKDVYAVMALANTTDYAFYRFDITLEIGDYFSLAELALFEVTNDDPEMMYDITGDTVEVGETPELVPVPAEEPAIEEEPVMSETPTFGLLFPFPMSKFLPRG